MRNVTGLMMLMLWLGSIAPEDAAAEIEGIQLQVDGLSCPFCALGLDKRLKQRAGLEDIQIHMKHGMTQGSLPPGRGIDVGNVRLAIQEAGFTLRAIKLTVIGTVRHDNGHFAIESRGDGTRFLLFDAAHQYTGPQVKLGQGLQQRLSRLAQHNTLVRVEGTVHEHADLPAGLMVGRLEEFSE